MSRLHDDERLDLIAEAIGIIAGQLRQGSMGDPKITKLETIVTGLYADAEERHNSAQYREWQEGGGQKV